MVQFVFVQGQYTHSPSTHLYPSGQTSGTQFPDTHISQSPQSESSSQDGLTIHNPVKGSLIYPGGHLQTPLSHLSPVGHTISSQWPATQILQPLTVPVIH